MRSVFGIAVYLICLLCGPAMLASHKSTTDSLLTVLDDVIANRETYLAQKQAKLDSLQAECRKADNDRSHFDVLIHLYDEYITFNTDSANNISQRMADLSEKIGDSDMITHAKLKIANILSATGMYHETLEVLDSLPGASIPKYLQPYYYHIKRTVYGQLEDFAAFEIEKRYYHKLTNLYRDSIMLVNEPGNLGYTITLADYYNVQGKPHKAIETMDKYISEHNLTEHERALFAWTFSRSYADIGNTKAYKENLLRASISDLKSSVREYISLRELALLLYEEGDLDRAYRFLTIAIDDAAKCNARQRILELNNISPKINGIYIDTIHRKKKALEFTIIAITVLSLVLLALLIYMRKQMRRIARARKKVEEAYDKLNEATETLKVTNEKLSEANNSIAEISELKEVYIGRYMDQCLAYIEKLDNYRKKVGKLVYAGREDELRKLVKTDSEVEDELKQFYYNFDRTFIGLFPTFIEDLNNLLLPAEALEPRKDGSLTAELRILALIRLGISDSDKIAKFLRYSLTTIYNYRTKIRNRAKGDRSKLEANVMLIGRSERPGK